MMKRLLTILMCLSLMFVLVGCGNNGSGVADEEEDTEEVVEEVEGEDVTPESETYTVGSTFEADGISVTLNSAKYYTGDNAPPEGTKYLLLNFTIANSNSEDYEMENIDFNTVIDGESVDTLKISPDYLEEITVPSNSDVAGDLDYQVTDNWTDLQTEVVIGDEANGQTATFTVTPDQVTQ